MMAIVFPSSHHTHRHNSLRLDIVVLFNIQQDNISKSQKLPDCKYEFPKYSYSCKKGYYCTYQCELKLSRIWISFLWLFLTRRPAKYIKGSKKTVTPLSQHFILIKSNCVDFQKRKYSIINDKASKAIKQSQTFIYIHIHIHIYINNDNNNISWVSFKAKNFFQNSIRIFQTSMAKCSSSRVS